MMSTVSDFPVFALPDVLRATVAELHSHTGAPIPLIVTSALGALSAAAQGFYMVERPGGLISPISLYTLIAAESGERKTTIDALLSKAIIEFEKNQRSIFEQKQRIYQGELISWESQIKAIKKIIEKDSKSGVISHTTSRNRLLDLLEKRPKPPQQTRILYKDCTPASLKSGLAEWPFAALISDEASAVLNLLIREPALLNSLWSGNELVVDRKSTQSVFSTNPRLTLSLMTQPTMLSEFIHKHGDTARGIGLLARFLVCKPVSTQGFRHTTGLDPHWQHLNKFNLIISKLLDNQITNNSDTFCILKFHSDTKRKWIDTVNDIEHRMQPGNMYSSIRDYASKAGENLARLLALFHILTNPEDTIIQSETYDSAKEVMYWFFQEFWRDFSGDFESPQFILDAFKLNRWLTDKFWNRGIYWIKKTDARKYCPNSLRKERRFHAALQHLLQEGLVWMGFDPMGTGLTRTLVIKPIASQSYKF